MKKEVLIICLQELLKRKLKNKKLKELINECMPNM
jgi:hypothetical protein